MTSSAKDNMLTVICTNVGTRYSIEYTHILYAMCQRYVPAMQRFVVLTDDVSRYANAAFEALQVPPGLEGWWAKIAIHNRQYGFTGRMLYLDLDMVLVQDVSPLVYPKGFWTIQDWLEPSCYNSSVMLFTPEEYYFLFDQFTWRDKGTFKTDQHYLTKHVPEAHLFDRHQVVSYKSDACENNFPEAARIVVFHGYPKPHQCNGWVKVYWK